MKKTDISNAASARSEDAKIVRLGADFRCAAEPVWAVLQNSQSAAEMRRAFTGDLRQIFYARAVASLAARFHGGDLERLLRKSVNFQIHHIVPVSLGGDNEEENLALVEPGLHGMIHAFIDKQRQTLEEGQGCEIIVPYCEDLVWVPDSAALPGRQVVSALSGQEDAVAARDDESAVRLTVPWRERFVMHFLGKVGEFEGFIEDPAGQLALLEVAP